MDSPHWADHFSDWKYHLDEPRKTSKVDFDFGGKEAAIFL